MLINVKILLRLTGLAIFSIASVLNALSYADQKPERIASTHLCTDQLLLLLAPPQRIVSLSHFASNPEMSMMAQAAKSYPANYGLAEELILYEPDLILTSQFGSPGILLLRSLGYQVLSIPVAQTIEDIRTNIKTVAEAIGEQARGAALIEQFDSEIDALRISDRETRPTIVVYDANGFTTGTQTLRSEVLELAGFSNFAAQLGLSDNRYLPLELLVMHSPLDALMINSNAEYNALAYELPSHPALRTAFTSVPTVNNPGKIWICGTPFVTQALRQLTEFRQTLVDSGQ